MQADIERELSRAHAHAAQGEQMSRDMRAGHLRHMRRIRDARRRMSIRHQRRTAGRSRPSGPLAYLLCYWWLVFPIVFGVLPALQRLDWSWLGVAAERAAAGWMGVSPLSWFVEFFARATGMSVSDAGAVLLLAAIVNGAVLAFALTQAPERRRT